MGQKKFYTTTTYDQQCSSNYEDENFLSRTYASMEEFTIRYGETYGRNENAKQLYLMVLQKIELAISQGNVNKLKELDQLIDYISNIEDRVTWRSYFDDVNNPFKSVNPVILACRHNDLNILEYLFCCDCKILYNFSIGVGGTFIKPNETDELCHNVFYYAIRSNNCGLLFTLINKWPGDYFARNSKKLDEILSGAYEKLKLRNVVLSEEMEFAIEKELISLRFFAGDCYIIQEGFNKIKDRIQLVLENINLLKVEYGNTKQVNEKFLLIGKFVAFGINMLKQKLKTTYDRLPWEEIEFCLVCFISSHIKKQEINLFYKFILNKSRILNHLEYFAKILKEETDIIERVYFGKIADFSQLKREEISAQIIERCPGFEKLYTDYHLIRDIHSLEKISNYAELALNIDPKEREGQIIIVRVLQVIGEDLKNTLESPKLSNTTSEFILLSLLKNMKQIVIDLRNSLSHAYSLLRRSKIMANTKDTSFFVGIQNDTKCIAKVITDIRYKKKINIICNLLEKIISSESIEEIKEVSEVLANVDFKLSKPGSIKDMEHIKLEKIIQQLSKIIPDKTNYENKLFNEIDRIINIEKNRSENIKDDYDLKLLSLTSIRNIFYDKKMDQNLLKEVKSFAENALETIPTQIESHNLSQIADLVNKISLSSSSRIDNDKQAEVNQLLCEILLIPTYGILNLKWIEKLRDTLNEKDKFIPNPKQRITCNVTGEMYNKQLELKLSELKSILKNNKLSTKSIGKLASYNTDKKLQAVVEMLVLDIMSILQITKKYLKNNSHFLDDYSPLLTGKCLRNHLAHHDALFDLFLDPSRAIILNAIMFVEENVLKRNKKLGKPVKDDPSKLKDKFMESLNIVTNQEKMFTALEEGNLEDLMSCLRKGADIHSKSIYLSTAFHFSAKGSNLDIIKFLLDQKLSANVKDVNGQSPIHIAAARARTNIVEYLITQTDVCINDQDNRLQTALHLAAKNGWRDTVETLLRHNANINAKNQYNNSPLHHAIRNNHIDVAKVLHEKERNVDIIDMQEIKRAVYFAADNGCLELVDYILRNSPKMIIIGDWYNIILNRAALYGYLDVVNALILRGAQVNAESGDDFTPLHSAVKGGQELVVRTLLKHGAKVDSVTKIQNLTPLHSAARDGYINIVTNLLENNADANIASLDGFTSLHFASQNGHLEIVAILLEHGANINAKAKNNASALHYAAENEHMEVVELLIKKGANVNETNLENETPLHIVALKGHKEILELLIQNKANVGAKDIIGNMPLHSAATNGSKDIIDILLKSKADINARNNVGVTPLYLAANCRNKDATVFLVENKANVNARDNSGHTPLCVAANLGHKDIVYLLIELNTKVMTEDEYSTPLSLAIEGGHKEIVSILIANGVKVNIRANGPIPLVSAILMNHMNIVKILFVKKNGANVNAEDGKPLINAVYTGNKNMVEYLLNNNASANIRKPGGMTPLHLASKIGHTRIVNSLLTRGAEVNAQMSNWKEPFFEEKYEICNSKKADKNFITNGSSPIHLAAALGHYNVVKTLLSNRAVVDIRNHYNQTPLELAVVNGHFHVVEMLLENNNVELNTKSDDGTTVLHLASQGSNLDIIKYLVNHGCNVRAKNDDGLMPIQVAASNGFKDTIEFFLSKGLSVNEVDGVGQTLLYYAVKNGQTEVVKYLICQGADINAKDVTGFTSLRNAVESANRDVINILLQNGAFYNCLEKLNKKPLCVSDNKDGASILYLTGKLFKFVKLNCASKVEKAIMAGAFINAKNSENLTPLHYAARKGSDKIVKILLDNKADPNAVDRTSTPLHYAAKYSHFKIVKTLLAHGAIYNAVSGNGKMPSDFAEDREIAAFFKLISRTFINVEKGKARVVSDLNKIKDISTIKAVMCVHNRENKSIVTVAILTSQSIFTS